MAQTPRPGSFRLAVALTATLAAVSGAVDVVSLVYAEVFVANQTGNLVVVTHQVHITGLTGVFPASGEAVVLQRQGADTRLIGRIGPF